MEERMEQTDQAIWQAATASRLSLAGVADIVRSISRWASEVLQKPVKAEAIGSVVTGITDASSDVDIVLSMPDAEDVLARLNEATHILPAFQVVRFVPTARAPVLSIARADGISVDLTANNQLPVYNSSLLKEYCELDWRLRPLACAVKRFAKAADVVGAASKNLSSYAWSLLAVFYLQTADLKLYLPDTADTRNLPCLQSMSTSQQIKIQGRTFEVGFKRVADMTPSESMQFSCHVSKTFPWRLLVRGFFKFYSDDLELNGQILSVRCGQALPRAESAPGPHIEDPFDPEHQLGSVLSSLRREAFLEALALGRRMLESCGGSVGSTFAELLEGHADLRSPVVWDTLVHSEELVHHRVRPQGSTPEESYSVPADDLTAGHFGHSLDEFQRRAILCSKRESVMLVAPTSSGKTVVAEAAMMQALVEQRSVIFCSPTKALSNQKFVDFQHKFPKRVGLLTGDFSIARTSPILVATTEVLRLGRSGCFPGTCWR